MNSKTQTQSFMLGWQTLSTESSLPPGMTAHTGLPISDELLLVGWGAPVRFSRSSQYLTPPALV